METDPYIKLVQEVDVEARCVLHGKRGISMQPRILNLGHGRAVIDMGQAHCRGPGCNGTRQWITLDLVTTQWTNVSEQEFKASMKHALETEMGVAIEVAVEEPVEEEPEPPAPDKKEVAVVRPAPAFQFRRPPLGGPAQVRQPGAAPDSGGRSA